jgi:endonuclease/exonuclease/phosphatase family metal-dependent hydrolase
MVPRQLVLSRALADIEMGEIVMSMATPCAAFTVLCGIWTFTAFNAHADEGSSEPNQVRVMTFNIRYNNPGDGPNAWPHRIEMVADLIRKNADLAGLQEAQLDQIEDLERALPKFAWYGVGRNDGKKAGEFCPVFYRHDRFELLKTETHWLSETPDIPGSKGWDTAITRLVTIVRFRDRRNDVEFCMLNTHLDHVGELARQNGAALVRTYVGELDGGLPVVVTGDFNCTPAQKPYQIMIAEDDKQPDSNLVDTRSITQQSPLGPDSTWNGFREIVPERRIDFIFVRPGTIVKRHRTLADRVQDRFPSDHLPVVADLMLREKK